MEMTMELYLEILVVTFIYYAWDTKLWLNQHDFLVNAKEEATRIKKDFDISVLDDVDDDILYTILVMSILIQCSFFPIFLPLSIFCHFKYPKNPKK